MEFSRLSRVLLLASICTQVVFSDKEPTTTIGSWSEFRAASIQGSLYIDGGQMYKHNPSVPDWLYSFNATSDRSVLYKMSYSNAFNTSTSNLTNLFAEIEEGYRQAVPDMYSGFMFADQYELYTYGGRDNPDVKTSPPANYVFGYELFQAPTGAIPVLGTNMVYLPSDITRYTTHGAGVNVPSEQLGFYFSGMTNDPGNWASSTGWRAADQLLQVDFSTFGSPAWSNSSFSKGNTSFVPRANAELVWIPVGTKGTLIAIGGVVYPEELFDESLSSTQVADSTEINPTFMQNLPIYDIATSTWYLQEVAGPNPGPLSQFCSVVASQNGSSSQSYEIYIYGGYNGVDGVGAPQMPPNDDVWVLSVPSFTWTKVYGGHEDGRRGHFCTAPYPDQMFVIGGEGEYSGDVDPIIRIFNLNTLQFQTEYDPTVWKNYTIPSPVVSAINAQPTVVWTDSAIGELFGRPYMGKIVTYYPYPPTSHHHSSHIAAIAGGIAAGVACLIALVLAFLWYRRRHPKAGGTDYEVHVVDQVDNWRNGIPKVEPSVTTTEVGSNLEVNPDTGGYYKAAAEAPGDSAYRQNTFRSASGRPRLAEAGGGTQRHSAGQTISPRSPHSPQSGTLVAAEVDGEERYEMHGMDAVSSQHGSPDMGARENFREHPLYPLSVSDGDGRSQASGPSYRPPSHSYSQTSRVSNLPYMTERAESQDDRIVRPPYMTSRHDNGLTDDSELPASPVARRPEHMRNISSISSAVPQVSPPLEPPAPAYYRTTGAEDDLDALEALHTGPAQFRPKHTRNLSSLSSELNQLPTPQEPLSEQEQQRQSTLLGALASPPSASPPGGTTPLHEERNPLLPAGEAGQSRPGGRRAGETGVPAADDDVYTPSSYSKGSTLIGTRSPVSRKPVAGLGIERTFSGHEGIGEERQTL